MPPRSTRTLHSELQRRKDTVWYGALCNWRKQWLGVGWKRTCSGWSEKFGGPGPPFGPPNSPWRKSSVDDRYAQFALQTLKFNRGEAKQHTHECNAPTAAFFSTKSRILLLLTQSLAITTLPVGNQVCLSISFHKNFILMNHHFSITGFLETLLIRRQEEFWHGCCSKNA